MSKIYFQRFFFYSKKDKTRLSCQFCFLAHFTLYDVPGFCPDNRSIYLQTITKILVEANYICICSSSNSINVYVCKVMKGAVHASIKKPVLKRYARFTLLSRHSISGVWLLCFYYNRIILLLLLLLSVWLLLPLPPCHLAYVGPPFLPFLQVKP